jgi:hypothetical protein
MNEGDQNDRPAADRRDAAARTPDLAALYEQDETAWLEMMSRLAAQGRHAEMDFRNLSEYLADMARRDRREVKGRLVALLAHRLKWDHQPERRSGPWRATIYRQQDELEDPLESATLYRHAEAASPTPTPGPGGGRPTRRGCPGTRSRPRARGAWAGC